MRTIQVHAVGSAADTVSGFDQEDLLPYHQNVY